MKHLVSLFTLLLAGLPLFTSAQADACHDLPADQNGELLSLCIEMDNSAPSCGPQFIRAAGSLSESSINQLGTWDHNVMWNMPMTTATTPETHVTMTWRYLGGEMGSGPFGIGYEDYEGPNLCGSYATIVFGDNVINAWLEECNLIDPDPFDNPSIENQIVEYVLEFDLWQPFPSINVTNSQNLIVTLAELNVPWAPAVYQVATRVIVTGSQTQHDPSWLTLAPTAPQMILRDPPGDNSHAFMDATHTTCYGQSISALNVMEGSVWASAKVGSAGSAGFLVETDYEASVELSGGLTMGSTQTSETTNEVCITTTNGYETGSAGQVGTDGDVFIGSALEYAYGKYVTLSVNNDCANPISLEEELVFALTGNAEQEFIYTEYTILGLIGQLTADLLLLDPASDAYKFTEDQLEVWEQAIALNNELKAEATTAETTTFSGGTTANYAHTGTSTTTKSIEMDVYLDVNFAIEMNLSAGGSGVSAGASARIRQETGTGSSSSSSTATTVGYTLSDDDTDDIFTVNRKTDPVFGTAIFELVEESSATSCPYAGGYQIDQPQIFFQDGTSTATLNDVPTGTEPTFEIQLCNPSDYGRYYNIKVNPNTNPAGAVLEGFGENLSATDEGFSIYLQPGECLENVVITFTQSSTSILDYEGIELYLYAACQPASAPLLSSIFLDVHFSDGTGVHDLDVAPAQLGVFPNPTSGAAQITLDAVQAQSQLTLTDATGRVYHTWSVPAGQSVQTLNGEAMGAGMYLLTLENAHQRSVKRVIIR